MKYITAYKIFELLVDNSYEDEINDILYNIEHKSRNIFSKK